MKAVVLEIKGSYAAVLCSDGTVRKIIASAPVGSRIEVTAEMFEAAQAKGVVGLTALADEMLPYVSTSLNTADIVSLASGIMKYRLSETAGFPFEKATANIYAGDVVVPVNLANNVTQLHQFLFGTEGYVPSDTVQEISYRIINDTGIQ